MEDSFGDGWNGASVIISVDGNAMTYTIPFGDIGSASIPVTDGDVITVEYLPGGIFDYEVYFAIIDSDGNIFFEDGGNDIGPTPGLSFEGVAVCPTCPAPLASTVETFNIRSSRADISWVPSDPTGMYLIEYDEAGFMLGEGLQKTVSGASTTLFNLSEKTFYDYYITALCSNGDTSVTVGPYTFETLWANDVGVFEIFTPQTGCALGSSEIISISIANFGGLPQTLIPFNYGVNGIPASVNQPVDGVFTGVIGTDSIEIAEFDERFDFSEPGEYTLQVWTEMPGDSVLTNDTTTITIISIPEITEYPYFDDFEPWFGGWTVASDGTGEPSWQYGTPNGTLLSEAVSGQNAWVTNLTGEYNTNEISYLVSPCLDFSSLTEDPQIAFNLFFETEACCDEAWVEVSIDGGESWSKVGNAGSGVNWYNDPGNNWWDGTGGFDGWSFAQNILTGTAGEPEVRVRFVFSSDFSGQREGIGIDNFYIAPIAGDDLAATSLRNSSEQPCGSDADQVVIDLTNVGSDPQVNFDITYTINGGVPITQSVQEPILPGETVSLTFDETFDSSVPGSYSITAWSSLPGDEFQLNDTITFVYRTASGTPYAENFEGGEIPFGWLTDFNVQVDLAHNSESQIMFANLYEFSPTTFMTSPVFGPIGADDTLSFDYRFVDFFDGTTATPITEADSLIVEFFVNCNDTSSVEVLVITGENHTPSLEMTTISIPLAAYADSSISINFRGVWGGLGLDYYLDIDNINIRSCGAPLGLVAEVTDASSQNAADGSAVISVENSEGPFVYEWSNGADTKLADGLEPGLYEVTVTDIYGCQDVLEVQVGITSSTFEPTANIESISLAPNPTTDRSMLNVSFRQPMDARIQLFNSMGQLVFQTMEQKVKDGAYELDLSQQNSGLYLVRIIAEGEIQTAKLIKASR
jgi:hypothetical protein